MSEYLTIPGQSFYLTLPSASAYLTIPKQGTTTVAASTSTGGAALTRSAPGLLFRDTFTRANSTSLGSDWSVVQGSWGITSNEAKNTSVADGDLAVASTDGWGSDIFVTAIGRASANYISNDLRVRYESTDAKGYRLAVFPVNNGTIDLYSPSGAKITGTDNFGLGTNTDINIKLYAKGTRLRGILKQNQTWINTVSTATNSTGQTAMHVGAGESGDAYFDDFRVCSDALITVSGLSDGYIARLTDGSTSYFAAPSVSGTATIKALYADAPGSALQVLNANSSSVASWSSGVWPGDTFTASGLTALSTANKAAYFDGDNDYASASAAANANSNMTLEARVFVQKPQQGMFVHLGVGTNGFGFGIGRDSVDTEGSHLVALYSNVRWIDTNTEVSDGWRMISMVLNGSGHPTLYVDGSSVHSDSVGAPNNPSATLYVGCESTAQRFSEVVVDEVRLWNTARASSSIAADYDQELVGNETNLVGYWKFNEGSGTSVADATTNTNNITLTNGPVWCGGMAV